MSENVSPFKSIEIPASLKEIAFQTIKGAIMSNSLKPGILYTEPAVARELGISRTPVREALIELASKGFVTFVRRKGFQINVLNEKKIRDLYAFRNVIETSVIRMITPDLTEQSLTEMAAIHARFLSTVETRDLKGFVDTDRMFHHFFASLTRNQYIVAALEDIRDLIDWTNTRVLDRIGYPPQSSKEHETIAKKLRRQDVAGAVKAMEAHLRTGEKLALQHMSQGHE